MAEFAKLSIFGTVFEVTTRYVDLQPVGMGAFGLVWCVYFLISRIFPGIMGFLKLLQCFANQSVFFF
ncbi:hypothetical protein EDD21DRAFT_449148, partial [Dissophora ornata]